jgi:hypothetical protein
MLERDVKDLQILKSAVSDLKQTVEDMQKVNYEHELNSAVKLKGIDDKLDNLVSWRNTINGSIIKVIVAVTTAVFLSMGSMFWYHYKKSQDFEQVIEKYFDVRPVTPRPGNNH